VEGGNGVLPAKRIQKKKPSSREPGRRENVPAENHGGGAPLSGHGRKKNRGGGGQFFVLAAGKTALAGVRLGKR